MSPIVTTMSAPAGRWRRVKTAISGDSLLQLLPAGFTLHSDNSFNDALAGTTAVNQWWNTSATAIVNGSNVDGLRRVEDSSGGFGPWVARVTFSEGSLGGNSQPNPPGWVGSGGTGAGGFTSTVLPANVREVFFGFRMRFSPGYVVHTVGGTEKLWYPTFTAGHIGLGSLVQLSDNGVTAGEPPFRLATYYIDDSGITRIRGTVGVLQRDTWHDIVIHQRLNTYAPTLSLADGFSRIWVDGTLVEDFQNYRALNGTQQFFFTEGRLLSTRGGGDSAVAVPAGGMWRDYDRMVLYYKVEA